MLNKAAQMQHLRAVPALGQISAQRPICAAPAVSTAMTAKRIVAPIQQRLAINGSDHSWALRAVRADTKSAEVRAAVADIHITRAPPPPPPTRPETHFDCLNYC